MVNGIHEKICEFGTQRKKTYSPSQIVIIHFPRPYSIHQNVNLFLFGGFQFAYKFPRCSDKTNKLLPVKEELRMKTNNFYAAKNINILTVVCSK